MLCSSTGPSSFSGLEGPPGSRPISMRAFSPSPLLSNSRILPSPPLSIADLLSEPLLFRCFSTLAPAPVRSDDDGDNNVGLNAGNVVLSPSSVVLSVVSPVTMGSSAGMVKSIAPAVNYTLLYVAISLVTLHLRSTAAIPDFSLQSFSPNRERAL